MQRFGGSLNLNVHFHTLVPDGVFDLSPRPSSEDLERILLRVIRRVEQVVAFPEDVDPGPLTSLQASSMEQRHFHSEPFRPSRNSVFLEGFSLHAGTRVHENDRDGLERLCRYAARPPVALERLSRSSDGRLVYRMKRSRDGVLDLVLTPEELMKKRILDHLGFDSKGPTIARARAPPELFDPGTDYSVNPVYPDP